MPTTTIRTDERLKARIAAVAEQAGKTAHALSLETLADAVERAQADAALHRLADERWAALKQSGRSVPWDDAKAYLQARAAGKAPCQPKARVPAP